MIIQHKRLLERLDSELKKWKVHVKECGYRECIQQYETLYYIRYGRNPK